MEPDTGGPGLSLFYEATEVRARAWLDVASVACPLTPYASSDPERMIRSMRPRGVGFVVAGWTFLGVAALVLGACVAVLGAWAWFSLADSSATDRAGTLGQLGATFAVLLSFSGTAFLTAAGLWRLRRWAWWLAIGLQLCLGALLYVRVLAIGFVGLVPVMALPLAVSWYLLRPGVRSLYR